LLSLSYATVDCSAKAGSCSKIKHVNLRKKHPVEAVYYKYSDEIYRFLYWQCSDEPLAEDITNEVFIRAWSHKDIFEDETANVRAWLYRVARNLLTDYWRKKRPMQLDQDFDVPSEEDVHGSVEASERNQELRRTLDELSEKMRLVIVMRFFQRLSVREVSLVLETSEANVRILQYRALKELKRKLS